MEEAFLSSNTSNIRLPKNHEYFNAIGDIEELNSMLGICIEYCNENDINLFGFIKDIDLKNKKDKLKSQFMHIKCILHENIHFIRIKQINYRTDLETINSYITEINQNMIGKKNILLIVCSGKLSNFINLSYRICRRAERSLVSLSKDNILCKNILIFMNLLSTYLLYATQYVNKPDHICK